ncbi:hypothetical protein [Paraburkholderia adhaesiva]|uniref:hypothetical protein n=1 Tax=Paraburkholderia adhaesiva TaxID=2883244 RepID=UPI001F3032A8|nr:hypothetical protein [Paraburkholderia adhaesiva]
MEHLVRIITERDRLVLAWLREHVGEAAIEKAVAQCGGTGKPYLSAICRRLGVRAPTLAMSRVIEPSPVAERSLCAIRGILASYHASTNSRPGVRH